MDEESRRLCYVQVDHCLSLGYRPDEIIMVTNIPFSYNGVRAIEYRPNSFPFKRNCVKAWYIAELFKNGILAGPYWLTDLDLFQMAEPDRAEPVGGVDIGIYGALTTGRVLHPPSHINSCSVILSDCSIHTFERLRQLSEISWKRGFLSEEKAANYLHKLEPDLFCFLNKRYNIFAWNNFKGTIRRGFTADRRNSFSPIIGLAGGNDVHVQKYPGISARLGESPADTEVAWFYS